MNKMILLTVCLNFFAFLGLSQDVDSTKLGAIHLKFENYQEKKHGTYNLEIRIQSEDLQKIFKSNLRDRISEKHSWFQYLPVGTYVVNVKLRSNYTLNIRKIDVVQDRVRFIKVDLKDASKRFQKVKIDREYRD